MTRRTIGFAAAVTVAALLPPAAVAVTLEVIPSTTMASIGDPITVDVVISDLGNLSAPSLGTFDLVLQYDPALFSFTGVVFGPNLGNPMAAEAVTTVSFGIVSDVLVIELSLLPAATLVANQPDTFSLFTASFDAVGAGSGGFTLAPSALGDENGASLVLDAVIPTTIDVLGGPADLEIPTLSQWGLLLLAALLALAAARRLREVER